MNPPPSSTWFTAPPHWEWLIVLYFFLGGIAGGCYALAAMIDLFGGPEDRPLARLGYLVAFPLVVVSGLLLIVDLYRPDRFWHMLLQSHTLRPMFKYWSPMSVGSWALLLFGAFSFVSFASAIAESGRIRWSGWRSVRPPSTLGRVVAVVGGVFGFYVAGYTGVLLAVTNRPIWSDTPLLGALFLVSAASSSAALMLLLAHRAGWRTPALAGLHRMDTWLILLELVVLVATLVSLGPVLRAFLNAWGVLLVVGVILVGMLLPLALSSRPALLPRPVTTAMVLVLVGGFLLRVVFVFSAESV